MQLRTIKHHTIEDNMKIWLDNLTLHTFCSFHIRDSFKDCRLQFLGLSGHIEWYGGGLDHSVSNTGRNRPFVRNEVAGHSLKNHLNPHHMWSSCGAVEGLVGKKSCGQRILPDFLSQTQTRGALWYHHHNHHHNHLRYHYFFIHHHHPNPNHTHHHHLYYQSRPIITTIIGTRLTKCL